MASGTEEGRDQAAGGNGPAAGHTCGRRNQVRGRAESVQANGGAGSWDRDIIRRPLRRLRRRCHHSSVVITRLRSQASLAVASAASRGRTWRPWSSLTSSQRWCARKTGSTLSHCRGVLLFFLPQVTRKRIIKVNANGWLNGNDGMC